jgi:hypothetical protein
VCLAIQYSVPGILVSPEFVVFPEFSGIPVRAKEWRSADSVSLRLRENHARTWCTDDPVLASQLEQTALPMGL